MSERAPFAEPERTSVIGGLATGAGFTLLVLALLVGAYYLLEAYMPAILEALRP